MTDRVADIWGPRTPHAKGTDWPVRVDLHLADHLTEDEVDRWVPSACVLCSNGCGCEIAVKDGAMVGIRGLATDVINHGRLGPKGLYGSTPWSRSPDRLTTPLIREGGRLVESDWPTAMGRIVEVSHRLMAEKGPLSHGFYTSGQLFAEEYYTLGRDRQGRARDPAHGRQHPVVHGDQCGRAEGVVRRRRPARLLRRYRHTDAIFLFGHNMAETQTVLWSRILDRTHGEDPPVIVCVDPRRTHVAEEAERTGGLHLAPRVGTNLALMNGLTHELFEHGWIDSDWVGLHTVGIEELRETVADYDPERVGRICQIDPDDLRRAARIFGTSETVLSTVLQGFYQSHQATAASVAVNNLHLLRGLIGRPVPASCR